MLDFKWLKDFPNLDRPSFIVDRLLHFARLYRARRIVYRSSLRPLLAGCVR